MNMWKYHHNLAHTPSNSGSTSLGMYVLRLESLFDGTVESGKKFKIDCIDKPQSNIMVISRNVNIWHGLFGSLLKQYWKKKQIY